MAFKTKLLAAGLLSVTLASGTAAAGRESKCESFKIKIAVSVQTYDSDDIAMQDLLDEAFIKCYGHQFIMDFSSIKRNRYQVAHTGFDPKFADRVTADVACMTY